MLKHLPKQNFCSKFLVEFLTQVISKSGFQITCSQKTLPFMNVPYNEHNIFLFQSLETFEFPDIIPLLRPLMHCVCLVYSNSLYYNSPARIIVLMQETCNLLIDNARKFMDPASLFQVC